MIITIGNNKGGTGKTTVSVHLSVALSKLGKKVLLIDNDTQCNSTQWLVSDEVVNSNLGQMLAEETINNPINLLDYILATSYENLWLLPNSVEASGLSFFFAQTFPKSLYYLRYKIREQSLDMFDFVLIDCPPTLDVPFGMALCASDAVIVPVEVGSVYSLRGLSQVLKLIDQIKETVNPGLTFMKLVMNRCDMRTLISRTMTSQIKTNFKDMYFETILPICTAFQQAEALGKTLFAYSSSSPVNVKYKKLAQEVIEATHGK